MKSAQLLQPNSLKPFLRRLLLLGPFLLSLYIPQDAKQTLELSLRLFFRQLAHWQVLKVKGFWRSLLCFLLPSPAFQALLLWTLLLPLLFESSRITLDIP